MSCGNKLLQDQFSLLAADCAHYTPLHLSGDSVMGGIVLLVTLLVAIFMVVGYRRYTDLIRKHDAARDALLNVNSQLKQCMELSSIILNIFRYFMGQHADMEMKNETRLMTQLAELYAKLEKSYKRDDQEAVRLHLATASELSGALHQLMTAAESYSELKADPIMRQVTKNYNEVAARTAFVRRLYNLAVKDLNDAVHAFPGNLLARMAEVAVMPPFESEAAPA